MKWLSHRGSLGGALVTALLLLAGSGGLIRRGTQELRETAFWVRHTHEMTSLLDGLLEHLLGRAHLRAYLLTRDEQEIAAMHADFMYVDTAYQSIRNLTRDNDRQQSRLDRLVPLLEKRRALFEDATTWAKHNSQDLPAHAAIIRQELASSHDITELIHEMQAEERSLLATREHDSEERSIFLERSAIGGALLGVVLILVTFILLNSEIRKREKTESELREIGGRLESSNGDLRRRSEELARKSEEVEAFVYIVSHDLRAPLVNIQGFSRELELSCGTLRECLSKSPSSPGSERIVHGILDQDIPGAIKFITASTTKFERLINALLALSRFGRQELQIEDLDVKAIVETTLDSMRQTVAKTQAVVTVGPLPNASGDSTAVGQVFSNLIGNALSYLKKDSPGKIEIGGEVQNGLNHYWVRDNGVGIPKLAQEKLFQVFQRFHPSLAPGEGMGLAIVKRVVERHGGRVWAESSEGVGTTFHLTLPRQAARKE